MKTVADRTANNSAAVKCEYAHLHPTVFHCRHHHHHRHHRHHHRHHRHHHHRHHQRSPSVGLTVCLSVILRYCVEVSKRLNILSNFSPRIRCSLYM